MTMPVVGQTARLGVRPRAGPMTPSSSSRPADSSPRRERLDQCASCFYDDLFDRHPPARRLFADDLIAQQGTLVDELLTLIAASDDLPWLPGPGAGARSAPPAAGDPRGRLRLRG